jgi:octopine/nopaline transport system permease protein
MPVGFFELMGFGPKGWGLTMLAAAGMTLAVASCGFLVGSAIGIAAAWAKLSRSRLARLLADGYTTLVRGVPDLLVIYLFYFGLSQLLGRAVDFWCVDGGFLLGLIDPSALTPELCGSRRFIELPRFVIGSLALGVVSGAYQAEVFRGAYAVLDRGQFDAAKAVGMHRLLMFRRVVAPQVLRHAIPGLGNVWQLALKESALVSVTGLVELLRQSQIGSGSTYKPFYFYVTAAALYLLITTASNWGFQRAEDRSARGFRRA